MPPRATGPRASRPAGWHYPLVILHTDEGIDGYTMGYGNQGDGWAIACLMRDVFWPKIRGENTLESERLWLRLRRANRDLDALSDAMSGMIDVALWDILGKIRSATCSVSSAIACLAIAPAGPFTRPRSAPTRRRAR